MLLEKEINWNQVLTGTWLLGFIGLVSFQLLRYLHLKEKLKDSIHLENNIYVSEKITDSFVLGFWNAKVYLSAKLNEEERIHVLHHELEHVHRKDILWKWVALFIMCLHWFNPLVWIGFGLFEKDLEYACDESVIAKFNSEQKKAYLNILLDLSDNDRPILQAPLTFNSGDIEKRIKHALSTKKMSFWMIFVAVLLVVGTGIGFLSLPDKTNNLEITPDLLISSISIRVLNENEQENYRYYFDEIQIAQLLEYLETAETIESEMLSSFNTKMILRIKYQDEQANHQIMNIQMMEEKASFIAKVNEQYYQFEENTSSSIKELLKTVINTSNQNTDENAEEQIVHELLSDLFELGTVEHSPSFNVKNFLAGVCPVSTYPENQIESYQTEKMVSGDWYVSVRCTSQVADKYAIRIVEEEGIHKLHLYWFMDQYKDDASLEDVFEFLKDIEKATLVYPNGTVMEVKNQSVLEEFTSLSMNLQFEQLPSEANKSFELHVDDQKLIVYDSMHDYYIQIEGEKETYIFTNTDDPKRLVYRLHAANEVNEFQDFTFYEPTFTSFDEFIGKTSNVYGIGNSELSYDDYPLYLPAYDLENGLYVNQYLDKGTLQFEKVYYDWEKDIVTQGGCAYQSSTTSYLGNCDDQQKMILLEHRNNFLNDFLQMERKEFIQRAEEYRVLTSSDFSFMNNLSSITVDYLDGEKVVITSPELMEELNRFASTVEIVEEEIEVGNPVFDVIINDRYVLHVYGLPLYECFFRINNSSQLYIEKLNELFYRLSRYRDLKAFEEYTSENESMLQPFGNIDSVEDLIDQARLGELGYQVDYIGGKPIFITGYNLIEGLYEARFIDKDTLQERYVSYDWEKDQAYITNACVYEKGNFIGTCTSKEQKIMTAHRKNFLNDFLRMDRVTFIEQAKAYRKYDLETGRFNIPVDQVENVSYTVSDNLYIKSVGFSRGDNSKERASLLAQEMNDWIPLEDISFEEETKLYVEIEFKLTEFYTISYWLGYYENGENYLKYEDKYYSLENSNLISTIETVKRDYQANLLIEADQMARKMMLKPQEAAVTENFDLDKFENQVCPVFSDQIGVTRSGIDRDITYTCVNGQKGKVRLRLAENTGNEVMFDSFEFIEVSE